MRAQRILHCITDLSADGAQRTLLRLIRGLPRENFQHSVVTLCGAGLGCELEAEGVSVSDLGMRRGMPRPTAVRELAAQIGAWRPDCVHGWMYHANIAVLLAAWLARTDAPVLWNVRRCVYNLRRDPMLTRWTIRCGAWLSGRVRAIVYCVEAAAHQHEALGFNPQKRVVIPNGFDLQRFSPHGRDDRTFRRKLGVPSDAVLIGAIGRYHPQKDFESLVRAAGVVHRAGYTPHFVLIGRGVDAHNEALTAAVAREGISDVVHLLGERQDVDQIMPTLDLFVSSSQNEGFSNVLGEALACGVPSVATAIGAAPALLEGVGWVVPPGHPDLLAASIIEAISSPGEERRARGMKGRLRMEQQYSLSRMVEQYAALYRSVALREGSRGAVLRSGS